MTHELHLTSTILHWKYIPYIMHGHTWYFVAFIYLLHTFIVMNVFSYPKITKSYFGFTTMVFISVTSSSDGSEQMILIVILLISV